MGVPSLYRTLVQKYANICDAEEHKTDYLFLDFNCLIHHCLHVKVNDDMNNREIEECVITEVIRYAVYIVTKVIKPTRLVYLAIDGPVPVAKMEKQRSRRYKKVQDQSFVQKLKKKYNIKDEKKFDSNRITPGTMFMSKLNSRLKNMITIGAFSLHVQNDKQFKIILSDSNVPGEGEAKIFDFLKNSKINPKIHIYGMDADLIILSMMSLKPNIRLMRESSIIDAISNKQEFSYIDIDDCKKALYNDNIPDGIKNTLSIDQFIHDFCLYSMFGGNDFVHPLPHCKMRHGGLEKLTRAYVLTYSTLQKPLVSLDASEINGDFIKLFFSRLQESEDLGMKRICHSRRIEHEDMNYEKEIEYYEHSDYIHKLNPFNNFYKNDMEQVNFKAHYEDWIQQYNEHFFSNTNIVDVIKEYIKSILWTHRYYQGQIKSWTYFNHHRVAPTLNDLCLFFDETMLKQDFVFDGPLSPFEQLLYVLPPQSNKILPLTLQDFTQDDESPIKHMYPIKFKLDAVAGQKNIYSEALLPKMNISEIRKVVYNVPLNEHDVMRNTIVQDAYHKTWSKKQDIKVSNQ